MTPAHRWLPFFVFFLMTLAVAMTCFLPIAMAQPAVDPAIANYLAQPTTDGVVDLSPLVDAVFAALASVVAAVVGFVGRAVFLWFKVDTDSKVRAYVQDALQRGADLALAKAREFALKHSTVPAFKNDFLEAGLKYVVKAVPDGLKHLGLDDAAIKRAIEMRLDKVGLPEGLNLK